MLINADEIRQEEYWQDFKLKNVDIFFIFPYIKVKMVPFWREDLNLECKVT